MCSANQQIDPAVPARATGAFSQRRLKQAFAPDTAGINPAARCVERRGSVLIVVIGLLLLLMLIGLTFFTFANQEHSAAEYYAESYKVYADSPNADSLFEWGLEQLIIGPHDDNQQSVLWPGRHSLVPNMLGMFGGFSLTTGNFVGNPNDSPQTKTYYPTAPSDRHPYNGGIGVNIISGHTGSGASLTLTGAPVVDQNFDGFDDNFSSNVNLHLLTYINLSGAAQLAPKGGGMGAASFTRQFIYNAFPAIDVGYTYPDINNMFLAHVGIEPTTSSPISSTGGLVVVPSFFRPGLMRDGTGTPYANWYQDNSNTASDTTTRSLQAHPGHTALAWNYTLPIPGNTASIQPPIGGPPVTISRYLSSAVTAGFNNPYTGKPNPRSIQYFGYPAVDAAGNPAPFAGNAKDVNGNPIPGQMGIYSNSTLPNNLDYPVDNDNDGIRDSVWLDLNYPATTLSDGRKMIPLFAFMVQDADSLINLNTAGNTSWLASLSRPLYGYAPQPNTQNTQSPPAPTSTPLASISHSNLGSSRSEINPFWALIADPRNNLYLAAANEDPSLTNLSSSPQYITGGPNSVFQTNRGVFGLSNQNSSLSTGYDIDRIEAANMDMLFMLWGRPNFNVTLNGSGREQFAINNITPGLWGDVSYLLNGLSTAVYGNSPPPNGSLSLFPQPGVPQFDDNGNLMFGLGDAAYTFNGSVIGGDPALYQLPLPLQSPLASTPLLYPQYATAAPFSSPLTVLPYSQPFDFTGAGVWTTGGTYGQIASLVNPNTNYPAAYPLYKGYQGSFYGTAPVSPSVAAYIPYQTVFPSSATSPYSEFGLLSIYPNTAGLIDEADERISDAAYATISDQIFPPDETAALQVVQGDYQAAIGQSRLRQLMLFNLDQNLRAQFIRRRFTTTSSDRRQHGFFAAISPTATSGGLNGTVQYNNSTTFVSGNQQPGNRYWEYASGNWDGTSPMNSAGVPVGPFLQFPPMVLSTSLTNTTGMDDLVPVQVDTPNGSNPLNKASAEPFRMELAALIGAKLNDPVTFVNSTTSNKYTPAPYQYRSSQSPATPWQQQLRLNINRFLTTANPAVAFGSSIQQNQQNPLRYRDLTPHPTTAQWNNLTTPSVAISGSSTGSFVTDSASFATRPDLQEYWARRDRQQMARDIYVMLYMFGSGYETEDLNLNGSLDTGEDLPNNGITMANRTTTPWPPLGDKQLDSFVDCSAVPNQPSTTGNPIRPLYQDWQLYEMAQFAVNIVDSLDRDSVITMFEFDMDLQDGWNLDDNPYGTAESTTAFPNAAAAGRVNPATDRGVVFGVEGQQLAFNEALVVVAPYVQKDTSMGAGKDNTGTDHPATAWNDALRDRTFTYLELSNVGPYDLPLSNSNWQIMVLNPANQGNAPLNPPTSNAWTLLTLTQPNSVASAGQPYTIGSYNYDATDAGTSGFASPVSRFVVDPIWSTTVSTNPDPAFKVPAQSQIVPGYNYTNAATPGFPALNLDLVASFSTANSYSLTDGNYNPINAQGGFLDMTLTSPNSTAGTAPTTGVVSGGAFQNGIFYQSTFILRRRLNLDRPAPTIGPTLSGSLNDTDNPWIEVDRITYWNQSPQTPQVNTSGVFFNVLAPNDTQLGGAANVAADIQAKLIRLQSRERRQPLDGYEGATPGSASNTTNPPVLAPFPPTVPVATGTQPTASVTFTFSGSSRVQFDQNGYNLGGVGVANAQYNTIGQTNYYTYNTLSTRFTLWQPHFDRDFASVADLLSIPLYGPSSVTQYLASPDKSSLNTLTSETPLPATTGNLYMPLVAQAKILRPQYPANIGAAQTSLPANYNPKFDNRWYRVLELLEVPPRENQQVETTLLTQYPWLFPQALQRTQGKMNPNTWRFGENLFALLDDSTTFGVGQYTASGYNFMDGYYQDTISASDGLESASPRNWWFQTLYARDGYDPTASSIFNSINNLTGNKQVKLYLPGTPSSRPFRSLSHFDAAPVNDQIYNRSSTDDTLLRTLPYDLTGNTASTLDKRGLFEARTQSDLASQSQSPSNTIDYYTRQRLLSKISGNTTPRSNVFLVWLTVGFFEAYEAVPAQMTGTTPTQSAVLQIGAEMTDQTRHRGFFIVDRSVLEDAWIPLQLDVNNKPVPGTGIYDYSKFVKYRKTLQ
jgi:hypothetical protein